MASDKLKVRVNFLRTEKMASDKLKVSVNYLRNKNVRIVGGI